jgi:hypothetical protein
MAGEVNGDWTGSNRMGVLRRLFGPSRKEIWTQLSTEIGAQYKDGGFWKGDKVEARHGEWTVTLDSYTVSTGKTTVVYTRMRAPYVNPSGFRFKIYRKGLFSGVGKWLGMQDIEIHDEPFDRDFIIKGTDDGAVRALFSNPKIRELVARQPAIHLEVKDDEGWFGPNFPDGVDELAFVVVGVIKDIERLKLLYELFAETLEQLCKIGAAYEHAPDVAL